MDRLRRHPGSGNRLTLAMAVVLLAACSGRSNGGGTATPATGVDGGGAVGPSSGSDGGTVGDGGVDGGTSSAGGSGGGGDGGPSQGGNSSPGPLDAAWAAHGAIGFDGLVDVAGNVYWEEPDGSVNGVGTTWTLVSVSPSGQERFRVALGLLSGLPIIVGDRVIVVRRVLPPAACEQALLTALSTADGSVQWTHDLIPEITPATSFPNACPATLTGTPSAGPSADTVLVSAKDYKPYDFISFHDDAILALDAATGRALWSIPGEGDGAATADLVLDERGNTYARDLHLLTQPIYSLSPSGAIRWSTTTDQVEFLLAAANGFLLDSATGAQTSIDSLRIRDAASGQVVAQATRSGQPILASDGLTYLTLRDTGPLQQHRALVRVDTTTGGDTWVRFLDPASEAPPSGGRQNTLLTTEVIRTSSGTYLIATQHVSSNVDFHDPQYVYDRPVLREIDGAGHEISATTLAAEGRLESAAALASEWFTVSLGDAAGPGASVLGFPLPGRSPATSGWISERGNMQRDHHAR